MGKMKNVFEERQRVENRFYWRIVNGMGQFVNKHKSLYYILSFTWGIIGTIIGYLVALILLPFGRIVNSGFGFRYFEFKRRTTWGFSIGTMSFVGKDSRTTTLYHEYGHTVHNAIFGPLVFIFVSLPSLFRFWYLRLLVSKRKDITYKYDNVWFEGTATSIGMHYIYDVHFDDH